MLPDEAVTKCSCAYLGRAICQQQFHAAGRLNFAQLLASHCEIAR